MNHYVHQLVPAEDCYWQPRIGDLVMLDTHVEDHRLRGLKQGIGVITGIMYYPGWTGEGYDVRMASSGLMIHALPSRALRPL